MNNNFTGMLKVFIDKACRGTKQDVDFIMEHLTSNSSFEMTRFVDYALSKVDSEQGIERIEYYLFNGSLIQRNYACLFLNRICVWKL